MADSIKPVSISRRKVELYALLGIAVGTTLVISNIVGQALKFAKGDASAGQLGGEIPVGQVYIIDDNPTAIYVWTEDYPTKITVQY